MKKKYFPKNSENTYSEKWLRKVVAGNESKMKSTYTTLSENHMAIENVCHYGYRPHRHIRND